MFDRTRYRLESLPLVATDLIHDRDPPFTLGFPEDAWGCWSEVRQAGTATAEFECVHREFVRSIKECCLDRTERSGATSVLGGILNSYCQPAV
jgi:hypothetical protein